MPQPEVCICQVAIFSYGLGKGKDRDPKEKGPGLQGGNSRCQHHPLNRRESRWVQDLPPIRLSVLCIRRQVYVVRY
jgi:hypothetical protein